MELGRTIIVKTAALKPVESLVRKSFLFRPMVRRFIAGDTLAQAIEASKQLNEAGLLVTLDYLGENAASKEESMRALEAYIGIVKELEKYPYPERVNISIKLTQLGLDQGDDFALENLKKLLAEAAKQNMFVRVDMEGSPYTERTIAILESVFPEFSNTGTVLQAYLYRTLDDTERLIKLGCRVRVVKGAYLEPPTIAFPEKKDVDLNFIEMSKRLIQRGNYTAIATHDQNLIAELTSFATTEGLGKERFEFQMLYGIRRDLQDQLKSEGYNVRVYVPFGDRWYPYFTRRLAERPANVWFMVKSLFKR